VVNDPATRQIGPIIGPRRWPADEPVLLPGNRLRIEVVTVSGRAASVELRVRGDRVEIWHHSRQVAVFDRVELRLWLTTPDRPLPEGEVIFSLDHLIDVDGRVAISLPDVLVWPFSPRDLETLRARI
jgi:hypothetical protein